MPRRRSPRSRRRCEEQIAPTPPQQKPEVVAPSEQKLQATPRKPEPAKVMPEQKPTPVKPKVVRTDAKKPTEAPPAPRTTAPPRAERQAPAASAMSSGASAAAVASYNQRVRARICSASINIRLGKGGRPARHGAGQLYAEPQRPGAFRRPRRLVGRCGLDAARLAMVARAAQPFPPFPSEMSKQSSMSVQRSPVAVLYPVTTITQNDDRSAPASARWRRSPACGRTAGRRARAPNRTPWSSRACRDRC